MTTEKAVDYRFCATGVKKGERHHWIYKGKVSQIYECWNCALRVTKVDLKGATDA